MTDSNNGGGVKLGMGVTLQLIAVLVAIGIAWGTLSAKQNAMETGQASLVQTNTVMLQKLEDIQERLTRLEVTVRANRLKE